MATIDSVHKLSPGRTAPSRSGEGLPILMYIIFVAGSYAGVIHMDPPPCIHASAYFAESAFSLAMSRFRFVPSGVVFDQWPNHPLMPPSSARAFGAGIVYHVHINAPVPVL